jgi:hypothetical protein
VKGTPRYPRKIMIESLDVRQVRAAENQSLFREVNERLVALNEMFDQALDSAFFVCECARMECIEKIEIGLGEYAEVRRNPRWFVVAPSESHFFADVEVLVAARGRYNVVEKIASAALVAEQMASN